MKKKLFVPFVPLLLVLLLLILSASSFLIIESTKYYASFYKDSYLPLALAILLEGFVLVLAMAKIYRLTLRIIQKSLMFSVFVIIVFTASLHHVNPLIQSITVSEGQNSIENIIKEEMKNLKEDLTVFDNQKQKMNTAIAANKRHEAFRALISRANEKSIVSIGVYLDIFILIAIRLVLQTCNLFCASMLGSYYRKGALDSIKRIERKKKIEYCICGCGQEVSQGRIYIKGHNLIPGKKESEIA